MFEHLASSHSTFFKNKFLTIEHQVEIERSERMIMEGVKRKKKCAVSCVSLNLNLILAAEFDHTEKNTGEFLKKSSYLSFFLLIYPFNHCRHHHQPQEIVQMWSKNKEILFKSQFGP